MFYASQPLDRADHLRKDTDSIKRFLSSSNARIVPYYRGLLLVNTENSHAPTATTLPLPQPVEIAENAVFLGLYKDQPWFALDYSAQDEDQLDTPRGSEWLDLRRTGPLLSADEGAILAYACAMMHWQQQSRFCAICGHVNSLRHAGHVRVCSNEQCGHESFPRTDPAVIMLVLHQPADGSPERCLLGRNPAWASGVFSTLAGFVEPGETLEQAVGREVFEEAGINVTAVSYVASQPWPFPQSIMLGFRAQASSTELTLEPEELAEAGWFTREELATFGNWGDDSFERQLPRPDSIARFLINSWTGQDSA